MKPATEPCFICGNRVSSGSTSHYIKCTVCGHEVHIIPDQQSFIVNDILSDRMIPKYDLTDRFKRQVLKKCAVKREFLVDIGSGSGKFLYRNASLFKRSLGIEVTDECVDFARNKLGLHIEKNMNGVREEISVATLWHSLEHVPRKGLEDILNGLKRTSSTDTRIIISVPNGNSLQYALFGGHFAYYDPLSHIHQFSAQSLDILMEKYGFIRHRLFRSFSYSVFGYLQGFMNRCNKIHNYSYYRKKRGQDFGLSRRELIWYDLYNSFLVLIFIGLSIIFVIYDYMYPEKGSVITACYANRT